MILYNTANPTQKANFQSAIFQGLADSGGLFMPEQLPVLPQSFFDRLPDLKFTEMAFEICHSLIGDEVNFQELKSICESAFDFEIPLVSIDNQVFCLELFHGPSLAFKDFGARFMSRIMAYFNQKMQKRLHVLVATSGDTGGAVAMGFHNVPGIRVTILFPKGRVSRYQEMQLTSLGGNVQALEVNGTFDDCQMLVKKAFSDRELSGEEGLTSANSINIARLIPQSLYYFWAWGQIQKLRPAARVVFSVPSGNFGNICAGAFAQKMGLPIEKLVASVNDNCVFADYLKTGKFEPALSKATLSNAMDVGNPSNFARI
ncbi:MAG TPA: threonine synthase, partial [Catalimonadaceae bacterium]|nr:threonine synthase [Catalimonadaceae bacterium]